MTDVWPFEHHEFDVCLDCYSYIEIESIAGRDQYLKELDRVLKPGGLICISVVSADDAREKALSSENPGPLPNSVVWPENNKFQKNFSASELMSDFEKYACEACLAVEKTIVRFGREVISTDIYAIFKKSSVMSH